MSLQRAIEQQTMIAQDQRGDLPEERPLASDTKATSVYPDRVQKPHRSKALGVAEGPVYHGKDFRLYRSLSQEREILPPSWNRTLSSHLTEDSALV